LREKGVYGGGQYVPRKGGQFGSRKGGQFTRVFQYEQSSKFFIISFSSLFFLTTGDSVDSK